MLIERQKSAQSSLVLRLGEKKNSFVNMMLNLIQN